MAGLQKKSGAATADAKAKVDIEITALQVDLRSAELKLGAMEQATAARWRDFEADVSAATARLFKSANEATGCARSR